ncbi:MAG: hypothetical protein KGJ43_03545 [Acidobacteriota bacterium]|nr:hypothetical protein [Acidobacteriota bacterium]
MATITFKSERFRFSVEATVAFSSSSGKGGGALLGMLGALGQALGDEVPERPEGVSLTFAVSGQGVMSVSPPAGELTVPGATAKGRGPRWVGDTAYTYEPSVARYDGHRPWVAHTVPSAAEPLGGSSGGLAPGAGSPQGSFAGLVALIGKADRVEASGTQTVDGQPTSAFTAHLNLADLVSGKRATQELAELAKAGVSSAWIELFITSAGMPVRETVGFSGRALSEAISTEALALEVPVTVTAPAPAKTITRARLRRLQRHRRVCIELPGPHHRRRRVCANPGEPESGSGSESLLGNT